MLFGTIILFAGIFIMVALKWEKHIVIISTSVLGAYITLRSISWVYGGWPPEM